MPPPITPTGQARSGQQLPGASPTVVAPPVPANRPQATSLRDPAFKDIPEEYRLKFEEIPPEILEQIIQERMRRGQEDIAARHPQVNVEREFAIGEQRVQDTLDKTPMKATFDGFDPATQGLIQSAIQKRKFSLFSPDEKDAMGALLRGTKFQENARARWQEQITAQVEGVLRPINEAEEAVAKGGVFPTAQRLLREAMFGVTSLVPSAPEGIGILSYPVVKLFRPDTTLDEIREAGRRLPEAFRGGMQETATLNLPGLGMGVSGQVPLETSQFMEGEGFMGGRSSLWGSTLEAAAFEEQNPGKVMLARILAPFAPGVLRQSARVMTGIARGAQVSKDALLVGAMRLSGAQSLAPVTSVSTAIRNILKTRQPPGFPRADRWLNGVAKMRDKMIFGGYGADLSEALARAALGARPVITRQALVSSIRMEGGRELGRAASTSARLMGRATQIAASPLGAEMPHFMHEISFGAITLPDTFMGRIQADIALAVPLELIIAGRGAIRDRMFRRQKTLDLTELDRRYAQVEEALKVHDPKATMAQMEDLVRAEEQILEAARRQQAAYKAAAGTREILGPNQTVALEPISRLGVLQPKPQKLLPAPETFDASIDVIYPQRAALLPEYRRLQESPILRKEVVETVRFPQRQLPESTRPGVPSRAPGSGAGQVDAPGLSAEQMAQRGTGFVRTGSQRLLPAHPAPAPANQPEALLRGSMAAPTRAHLADGMLEGTYRGVQEGTELAYVRIGGRNVAFPESSVPKGAKVGETIQVPKGEMDATTLRAAKAEPVKSKKVAARVKAKVADEKKLKALAADKRTIETLTASKAAFARMSKSPKYQEWAKKWQEMITEITGRPDLGKAWLKAAYEDVLFRADYDAVINATRIPQKAVAIRKFLIKLPEHEERIKGLMAGGS